MLVKIITVEDEVGILRLIFTKSLEYAVLYP